MEPRLKRCRQEVRTLLGKREAALRQASCTGTILEVRKHAGALEAFDAVLRILDKPLEGEDA